MRTHALSLVSWMVFLGACGAHERDCPESASVGTGGAESAGITSSTGPRVVLGTCDTSWLPPGTTRELSDADEAALADAVRAWLAGEHSAVRPASDGIVFAKSEDDRGDDPPYPPEASALGVRACGLGARWLIDHLHRILTIYANPEGEGVVCDENVCCVAGMEYVPHGTLTFARGESSDSWAIESALFVSESTLIDEIVTRNRAFVARSFQRLSAQSCEGEPLLSR